MKRIILAVSALLFTASVANADPYANLYSNTLTITGADGMKSTIFINQDMSWEQHTSSGAVLKGTYAWKDPQTACFTVVTPPPKSPDQATNCYPAQTDHNVGDTWTMNGPDKKPMTLTISAGR
ncbi:MAG: hypothetical protein ABSD74_18025 [Rhizomicrobium sp.]|jgi:hypothetical protein